MRSTSGLTLVELTATLAIASLVMVATLGVVANMSRSDAVNRGLPGGSSLEPALRGMLACDLLSARRWRTTKSGFELETHSSLSRKTLELSHAPASVGYEVRRIASRSWLVRKELPETGSETVELICPGVATIGPGSGAQRWRAVPDVARVTLRLEGRRQDAVEFVFRRK